MPDGKEKQQDQYQPSEQAPPFSKTNRPQVYQDEQEKERQEVENEIVIVVKELELQQAINAQSSARVQKSRKP